MVGAMAGDRRFATAGRRLPAIDRATAETGAAGPARSAVDAGSRTWRSDSATRYGDDLGEGIAFLGREFEEVGKPLVDHDGCFVG